MDTVIKEINESLFETLNKLETRKSASQKELEAVNIKIDEKVDEAKKYKVEVDNAKNKIKELEEEIESLETDLADLNERFGKRDLTAILEAGNKEINFKITEKQNEITKHRQKIGELSERARSIKDLLISLKKDKTSKEEKLDILTKSYDYYSESLNKITDYAKNNPDSLKDYDTSYNNLNYDYDNEPLTEVFDEIESMDKEDEPEVIDDNNSLDVTPSSIIDDESKIDLTPDEEAGLDDNFTKIQSKNLNFEELNKSIDDEYNYIFGTDLKEDEDSLNISEKELNLPLATNIFDTTSLPENFEVPDIFGNDKLEVTANDLNISDFFLDYDLDFNKFSKEDQELLKNIFDKDNFHKILDILKNNQINLNKIYGAVSLFEKSTPEVIDQNLTKLLLSNQSKVNIELVLGSLGNINNNHLVEAINSYGAELKDANITELLMKAKKLAGAIDTTDKPEYLKELTLNDDEITVMESNTNRDIWEYIITFPEIIITNYNLLKDIGATNLKEIFTGYPQMFIMNPEKFKAIFIKYDQTDLIRCLEKNASVIEKL
ncbi:MAG: hypothetical protein PHX04_02185 [Bacilli bacterium]|nr:hypothetical protein [Bacilli bacterium]